MMTWRDHSIKSKLWIGFGIVLFFLVAISCYTFFGLSGIDNSSESALAFNNQTNNMLQREIDHHLWVKKLSDLFLDDNVKTVQVQTDDHKCSLGKWLYGEEIKKAARDDDVLAARIDAIKEPHRLLHATAIAIKSTYVDYDVTMEMQMAQRWIDHLVWTKALSRAVMTGTAFEGILNPRMCAFGKWYYTYKASNRKPSSSSMS